MRLATVRVSVSHNVFSKLDYTATMALRALQTHLEQTFYPPAAQGLDARLCLKIGEEELLFTVTPTGVVFDDTESADSLASGSEQTAVAQPDATFFFEDVDTAWALLSGRADAFEAFMSGRFRADGYLMWAFSLMAMFQSDSLPETPTE